MNWKRIGKALLFPPAAVLIVLTPIAAAALVYSMLRLEETSPVRIGSYVLAFYTLVIVCVRVPKVARSIGTFKRENKYIQTWSNDPRLRMNITVGGSVLWNGAYAALQLGLAIYYRSAWFYSLAAYYATLAAMRCSLVWHTLRYTPGEQMRQELTRYRACGWVFLLTNLALSGIMFYMIYEHRVTRHGEIITITMAAYTFTTLTMAIINVIRYRKFNSPILSAAKAISLAAACVSMLTLENTMLVSFNKGAMPQQTVRLFLALSGGVVSAFIIAMAIYMIVQANRKLKSLEGYNDGR